MNIIKHNTRFTLRNRHFKALDMFLDRANRIDFPFNQWCKVGPGSFYLRSTSRYVPNSSANERIRCLDMATSSVEPEHQNQGIYSQVMERIERVANHPMVYHENVLNPFLYKFLIRHGYKVRAGTRDEQILPCLFKIRETRALDKV